MGQTPHPPDRIVIAEINGDGLLDVIVSEERYPGKEPHASLLWFEHPADLQKSPCKRRTIITEYSLNNLDVADLDRDGDNDIVTCGHKGLEGKFRLQIFENDGGGNFTEHLADRGKESHLGARLADVDSDGDLDIVSAAWDNYQYLHLRRDDALKSERFSRRHASEAPRAAQVEDPFAVAGGRARSFNLFDGHRLRVSRIEDEGG